MFQKSNKEKVHVAKTANVQVISYMSNLACTLSVCHRFLQDTQMGKSNLHFRTMFNNKLFGIKVF